jgi:hypothetical protein
LPLVPTERVWRTKSGKAEFIPFNGLAEDPAVTGADVLKLTTESRPVQHDRLRAR